jgi:catechol 2,3-dioxygenase-like lactoylglutathione lyase family enzyme
MNRSIAHLTYLVRDYDEAIAYFVEKLHCDILEDTPLGDGKRWVIVRPRGEDGASLLLAKAATPEQESAVGNQGGGRVFLFLHTDNFWLDYNEMKSRGVEFMEEPRTETYGTVVVFKDLYGNKWDLLQPK